MAVKKGSVKECFIETALGLANVKSNRFGRRYIWNLQTRLNLHKAENLRTVKLSVLCVAKRSVCPCRSVGAIRGVLHKCLSCMWVCPTHCCMNSGTFFTLSLCSGLGLGSVCTGSGLAAAVECSHCSVRKRGVYWKEFINSFCLWISQLLSLRKALAGWGLCWSGRSDCEWFKGDSWITAFLFFFYSILSLPFLLGELFVQLLYVALWLISVCWVWSLNRRGKYEWTSCFVKNWKKKKYLEKGLGLDKATFICFLFKISIKHGKKNRISQ